MFNFLCMVFMTQGIMTIASRMVWTFARDRGLGHLSPALAPVHPTLKVPVWSVVFVLVWCVVLGLICECGVVVVVRGVGLITMG